MLFGNNKDIDKLSAGQTPPPSYDSLSAAEVLTQSFLIKNSQKRTQYWNDYVAKQPADQVIDLAGFALPQDFWKDYYRIDKHRKDDHVVMPTLRLEGYNFKNTNLKNADLTGQGQLRRLDFSQCDFTGADLSGAILKETAFDQCHFSDAKLEKATLLKARFTGSDFKNAKLPDAFLGCATFDYCDFSGANLDYCDGFNVAFKACNLNQASFKESLLDYSSFEQNTTALGTDFSKARLDQAHFDNVLIDGKTNFDQAQDFLPDYTDQNHVSQKLNANPPEPCHVSAQTNPALKNWLKDVNRTANHRGHDIDVAEISLAHGITQRTFIPDRPDAKPYHTLEGSDYMYAYGPMPFTDRLWSKISGSDQVKAVPVLSLDSVYDVGVGVSVAPLNNVTARSFVSVLGADAHPRKIDLTSAKYFPIGSGNHKLFMGVHTQFLLSNPDFQNTQLNMGYCKIWDKEKDRNHLGFKATFSIGWRDYAAHPDQPVGGLKGEVQAEKSHPYFMLGLSMFGAASNPQH